MTYLAARPTLQSRRLNLRWITTDDDALMLAIWNDPGFIEYVGDRGIRTLAQAREAITGNILGVYDRLGYGPYRVALREDDQAIGICGLFKRENLEIPDIGYGFLPEFCGQGFAIEAAQCVQSHAESHMLLPGLAAIVSPQNLPSIRLLEKLGMKFERSIRMPGEDKDVALYGIEFSAG